MTNGNDILVQIETDYEYDQNTETRYPRTYSYGGLTKRELFAAMAMQGACADPNCNDENKITTFALKCADRLIEKLNN